MSKISITHGNVLIKEDKDRCISLLRLYRAKIKLFYTLFARSRTNKIPTFESCKKRLLFPNNKLSRKNADSLAPRGSTKRSNIFMNSTR